VVDTANAGAKSVSVINTSTNTLTATVTVGLQPVHAAISPDGQSVYVANLGSASGRTGDSYSTQWSL